MSETKIVGICGSGLIGRGWAILFAAAGYRVRLYDLSQEQLSNARIEIESRLKELFDNGMMRGSLSMAKQLSLIEYVTSLAECVKGASYVQECIPERVTLKTELFRRLDSVVGPNTILASSTSSISPSQFTADLVHKENCIISHPINPPYYIRLIEIVPAPWTSLEVVAKTRKLMEEIGQRPVTFTKEIPGFGVNRIQLSIMNEAYHLVTSGIMSAADVDTLMVEGMAMRYAWQGPFETTHLLANGFEGVLQHFGPSFRTLSQTFKPAPSWELEECQVVIEQLNEQIPLDQIEERRKWRDERLVALAKLKVEMEKRDAEKS